SSSGRFRRKSPAKRFLSVLGLAMFGFYLVLGIIIIFWKDFPLQIEGVYRILFGLLLIVYSFIRFVRLWKSRSEYKKMLVERYIDRCCLIPFYILLIAVYAGCTGAPSSEENTILTGKVSILVDETFEPIAEDQVTVFQSSYKHTEIDLISKPENNVVADLLNGKAEIAILARLLSEEEMKPFEASKFRL